MKKPIWKDSERGGIVYASEIKLGRYRVSVHRYIGYPPDQWLLTTYDGMFDKKELKNKDLDKAKIEALYLFKEKLDEIMEEVYESINELYVTNQAPAN